VRQANLLHDVADTSIQVYRDVIVPTKETRQRRVLIALANCSEPPTAYELFQQMRRDHTASDLNDVRPRLTELWKAGRIVRGDKRRCLVTGHTAYTWRLR
jgi:hypothetical protein